MTATTTAQRKVPRPRADALRNRERIVSAAREMFTELGPDESKMVKGMVLSGGKYPLAKLVAVYEAIDRVFGKGDLALCWDIGKFAGEYEVKLLHKVFLNVAKLEYWLKIAGASWKFYYSHGKLTASIEAKGAAEQPAPAKKAPAKKAPAKRAPKKIA